MTFLPALLLAITFHPKQTIGQPFGLAAGGIGYGATCTFDPVNYYYSPQCALANAFPFYRQSGISCEDCLKECQKRNCNKDGLRCASVVYDTMYQTCDLFAVCAQPPYRLIKCPGRIYLQPVGVFGCETTPTSNATQCKQGETSKVIAVPGYSVDGVTGKDVPGLDQDGCGKACLTGKLPDGSSYECRSAQFANGKCTLSTEVRKAESNLKKADGTTFFQQLCLPTDLVKDCPDIFFEAPQKILVGQNRQTIDVSTIGECVQACLQSQQTRGFTCTSGIYYFQESQLNCILNAENRNTRGSLYIDENEDVETYFELLCGAAKANAGKHRLLALEKKKSFKDAFLDLPVDGEWAHWSFCKGRKSVQVRFRQCREIDSRRCPMETRSCDPTVPAVTPSTFSPIEKKKSIDENLINDELRARDAIARGPCRAVVINGKKNCKLGQKKSGHHMKELCLKPVDC